MLFTRFLRFETKNSGVLHLSDFKPNFVFGLVSLNCRLRLHEPFSIKEMTFFLLPASRTCSQSPQDLLGLYRKCREQRENQPRSEALSPHCLPLSMGERSWLRLVKLPRFWVVTWPSVHGAGGEAVWNLMGFKTSSSR